MPLVAHCRFDPRLADLSLALTQTSSPRSPIIALTTSAMAAGVVPGMTVAQGRAICDGLRVRPLVPAAVDAAVATLADVAGTMSSRVEIGADGNVFLDCEGTAKLCASESELATVLAARSARQALPAWVGIADSKLGAAIAARHSSGVAIIPPGGTRGFLAPLPLRVLEPDLVTANVLASWGIRRIGDLAALPAGAVAHRLGPGGARLLQRARGEDEAPLTGRPLPKRFSEGWALDYSIDRLEPLMFVFRRLIDNLLRRIALHGFGCAELEIRFRLEGGGREVRVITSAAPSVDAKTLLMLVRAHFEKQPPEGPMTDIAIDALPARLKSIQLDFLKPCGPAPSALAEVVARLAILCGPDRVGVLRRSDSHRPDAMSVATFQGLQDGRRARTVAPSPCPSGSAPVVRMAMRALRPALPLEVFETRSQLDYVRGAGFGGRVVHVGGPWRLRGEWWTEDPFAREYYDVELSDGGVYRVYCDLRTRCWFADGVYD